MRLDAQRLDAVADAVGQLNKRFDNYVIVRKVDELNARFDNYMTRRQDGDVIPFPGRFRSQPTPPKKRTFTAEQLRLTEENIGKAKEALARAPEGIQRRARRKELEGWEKHLRKIQETIRDQRGDGLGTKVKAGLRKAANFAGGKPYRAPPRAPQKPLSKSEFAKASPQGQRSELGRMIKAIPDRQDADEDVRAHRVSVRMRDPTLVASGQKLLIKHITVTAASDDEAKTKAEAFYKKRGYKSVTPYLVEKKALPDRGDAEPSEVQKAFNRWLNAVNMVKMKKKPPEYAEEMKQEYERLKVQRGDASLFEEARHARDKAGQFAKKAATKVGRGLQRVSGPATLAGFIAPPPVGLPLMAGGIAAGLGGRKLEKWGSGKIKRGSWLGQSTEGEKRSKRANKIVKQKMAKFAPQSDKSLPKRPGNLLQKAGRKVGNFVDRRRLSGQRKELEWALGGEEQAKQYGTKGAKEHGWVEPGYWAGQAKKRQGDIKEIEKRMHERGDALPDAIRHPIQTAKFKLQQHANEKKRGTTSFKPMTFDRLPKHEQERLNKTKPLQLTKAMEVKKPSRVQSERNELQGMIDKIPQRKLAAKVGVRQIPGFGAGTRPLPASQKVRGEHVAKVVQQTMRGK